MKDRNEKWESSNLQLFWGEIAPCDHLVQIYENENAFLSSLEGFVGAGIISGDSIIIIATVERLLAIEERMVNQGFDVKQLIETDQYIRIEAHQALARFMVDGSPDENLFHELISALIKRAKKNNRKVRAFGEMVALLWEQGLNDATVKLENLWNQVHCDNDFTLLHAYPKSGFMREKNESMKAICSAHTKIIDGSPRPSTEVYYRNLN